MPMIPGPRRRIPDMPDEAWRGLWSYVWCLSGWHQLAISLLAIAVALLTMAPIELHRRIVDEVIVAGNLELLMVLGAVYLGIILVRGGVKYTLLVYQGWLTESAAVQTRRALAGAHERHREKDRSGNGDSGEAVAVIGQEVDKLAGFVGEGLSQPAVNFAMLLAIGGYMVVVQPLIAAVALGFLLPQAFVVPAVQVKVNRLIGQRLEKMRDLGEGITGTGADDADSAERLLEKARGLYRNRMRIYVFKFLSKTFVNVMNALAPLSVLVFGGYQVIQGEMTLGAVVAFITGLERVSNPLRDLVTYYRVAAQAGVQHRKIAAWAAR